MFPGKAGLPDTTLQRADPDRAMQRHWHGNRAADRPFLHNQMTALLSGANKAAGLQNPGDFLAGKNAQLREIPPRRG